MDLGARLYIAGASTFVGAALRRRLAAQGFTRVIDDEEPNLRDPRSVDDFLTRTRPEFVFVAAGETAGIDGNERYPADLMTDNLRVAMSVIPAAARAGVNKLQYLASSCMYPKHAPQPLAVSSLWTGALEPTSAPYAVAKLAGVALCEAFRRQHGARFFSAIAGDAYGPGDDFGAARSHVVAALIARMHDAKRRGAEEVDVWGSGEPRREFIYIDDLADAAIFAMRRYDGDPPINLGTGASMTIGEVAQAIREVVGFAGRLRFDRSRPDGMPFKGLDSTPLASLGWKPCVALREGLARTYRSFLETIDRTPSTRT